MRTVILPDPELAPYVRLSMIGRFDTEVVHMPASADAQLLVYLKGGALVEGPDGRFLPLPAMFVSGARLAPSVYRVVPGSVFVGVVFRPGGLQACFGVPAQQLREQALPLAALLSPAQASRFADQVGEAADASAVLDLVRQVLLARPRSLARRDACLPPLTRDSLLLPSSVLAQRCGIGTRQFERRFLASYGVPLRDFRRLARFSHALAQLMAPSGNPLPLAALAAESRYSDQAHFTRDFHAFVGQTPRQFLADRLAPDAACKLWQFDRRELSAFADLV